MSTIESVAASAPVKASRRHILGCNGAIEPRVLYDRGTKQYQPVLRCPRACLTRRIGEPLGRYAEAERAALAAFARVGSRSAA